MAGPTARLDDVDEPGHALLNCEGCIGTAHWSPYPTGMHGEYRNPPVSHVVRHEPAGERVERGQAKAAFTG